MARRTSFFVYLDVTGSLNAIESERDFACFATDGKEFAIAMEAFDNGSVANITHDLVERIEL